MLDIADSLEIRGLKRWAQVILTARKIVKAAQAIREMGPSVVINELVSRQHALLKMNTL